MASSANIRNRAKQLKGRPVRVVLHDGSSYIGWIAGLDPHGLLLSVPPRGKKKSKKKPAARSKKARVSAFQPLFGGGYPGNAGSGTGTAIRPEGGWGFGGGPGGGYASFGGYPGRPGLGAGAYGFPGGPRPGRPGFIGFGGGSGGYGGSGGSGGSQEQSPEDEAPVRPRRAGLYGMVQKVQKYMPLMKMGYNAIKSIIPLFNGIKALMV
ncbi:hypothetical protein [uncultured Paenibacillus sp.]|uniref:hypothetical protein n=1 Tax=uncultured Paenibacillus sp. TaxID=227322 RepID=UPI0015B02420|nr:hypothetical protein [uncultured Paenibacillus sp.]